MLQEVRELRQENRLLRERLDKQQEVINSLSTKVAIVEQAQKSRDESSMANDTTSSVIQKPASLTKVNISGQVAAGFFNTGREGMYPNGEFRLDEARLFLDAQAWNDVYAYVELNAMTRESGDDGLRLGEAYIDFERIVKWHGLDSLLNVRLGRFYTPFGEEYQVRYPIEDPLISHSLAEFWGYDTGLELYGSHGPVQYAVAVQNGDISSTRDFTKDKTVAVRINYQPAKWFRVSGSAMRTGNLSDADDPVSSMWFGNGFFRSLGNPATTTHYHADAAEGDLQFLFSRGNVKLAGGAIRYNDNDSSANNGRDVYYYSAEGMFSFTRKFYGAARYSQILADKGFPIVGNGEWSKYFYEYLTDNLWRLSIGLGYTPNPNLVFKIEYTLERGTTTSGESRDHEDFFGAQVALRF
jgi:hypothetical protein